MDPIADSLAVIEDGAEHATRPVYKTVEVFCGQEPITHAELDHYVRTPLKWMTTVRDKDGNPIRNADGTFKLVPRRGG